MMQPATGVLISCEEASEAFALDEIRAVFPDLAARKISWLDAGVALIETEPATDFGEFGEFAHRLELTQPVFIRHIAPATYRVALTGEPGDLDAIWKCVESFVSELDSTQRFSVQTRYTAETRLPYKRVAVNESISNRVNERTGAELNTKMPQQVISILCHSESAWIGLSRGADNRSLWPGGAHRFQREEGQISRAEFKLLEARELFGFAFPTSGVALDIGASPGGWTRVLLNCGLRVVAVDPADLDDRLLNSPGLVHIRKQIQAYLSYAPNVDIIVNDMRMDALESTDLMLKARSNLLENGLAVMTLKLPEEPKAARNNPALVNQCVDRLREEYEILGVRQLYHNRSEVTVAMKAE